MTAQTKKLLAEIRCGKFKAQSNDCFALSFRVIRDRDGLPRTVSVHGAMPVIFTRWSGSGYPPHIQSLQ